MPNYKSSDPGAVEKEALLDTCILQYLSNDHIGKHVLDFLRDYSGRNKCVFSLSEIVFYEHLIGLSFQKEKRALGVISFFKRYAVSGKILLMASWLSSLYRRDGGVDYNKVSVGDHIIAATSVLTKAAVITANCNDFPRPFFIEEETKNIMFKKGAQGKDQLLVVQALVPNSSFINKRFSERL